MIRHLLKSTLAAAICSSMVLLALVIWGVGIPDIESVPRLLGGWAVLYVGVGIYAWIIE